MLASLLLNSLFWINQSPPGQIRARRLAVPPVPGARGARAQPGLTQTSRPRGRRVPGAARGDAGRTTRAWDGLTGRHLAPPGWSVSFQSTRRPENLLSTPEVPPVTLSSTYTFSEGEGHHIFSRSFPFLIFPALMVPVTTVDSMPFPGSAA